MAAGHVVTYRPGRDDDLDACLRTWRAGLEGYQAGFGLPPVPDDLGPLRRLLAHVLATDPDRFGVAVAPAGDDEVGGPERLIGFSSATVREGLWFLGMLFVELDAQARGVGSALLDRAQAGRDVDPGGPAVPGPGRPFDSGITTWGVGTDTAQPVSNGMYARRGMLPRVPV
ncbi:MAG: hypothetical protein MUQ32_08960, partial [Chloroflexi bacterium]|nr:hypothetical protein [Chloroflexota bacterium]